MTKELTFKDVYKFPLQWFMGTVYAGEKDCMAFNFANDVISENPFKCDQKSQIYIVECINGEEEFICSTSTLSYDKDTGVIKYDGKDLIIIRGWGYLTGKGTHALGLDEDVAVKLQDDFAEYIIEKLKVNS